MINNATLTVSIPSQIKIKLEKVSKKDHIKKSEIVRVALKQYFSVREFEELRKMVMPKAQKQGFYTDEDVFKAIS
jgi:metal-responsive CopG/Arc/MetJ family transcriptional regulator